jgi:hypothetical protein
MVTPPNTPNLVVGGIEASTPASPSSSDVATATYIPYILARSSPSIKMGGKGGGGKGKKSNGHGSSAAYQQQQHQSKRRLLFDDEPSSMAQSSYHSLIQKLVAVLIGVAAVRLPWMDLLHYGRGEEEMSQTKNDKARRSSSSSSLHQCNFYMGRSTIAHGGWGVFTKAAIAKDSPVLNPELILQVPDIIKTQASGMHRILNDYMWDAKVTGGHLEGITATFSVWPGLGMLANGHLTAFDVVPDQARRHPVTRHIERSVSPVAGAVTNYHAMQYYAYRDIAAQSELFVNYGLDWIGKLSDDIPTKVVPSNRLDELFVDNEDFCLDRLRPGVTEQHGYGAVLTQRLAPAGTVLLPVPVLPLHRDAVHGRLLMNYCYGHEMSDIVLYPYSPMSNYINHDGIRPNARLRWRRRQYDDDEDADATNNNNNNNYSIDFPSTEVMLRDQPPGLLLELVAIRTIRGGEQVTIDYGRSWEAAWERHLAAWNTTRSDYNPNSTTIADYVYPDDPSLTIRTEQEQQERPYASNLLTVCYRYDEDHNHHGRQQQQQKRRLHSSRLEPCRILERLPAARSAGETGSVANDDGTVIADNDDSDEYYYRVEFTSDVHQKTLARPLIAFTDKPGTSDQALGDAFRHVMGLDDIFPHQWLRNINNGANDDSTHQL